MTNIRNLRESIGLTQVSLATQAEIALPTLQQLEAGQSNPSLETLERIGKILGFTVEFKATPCEWDLLSSLGLPLMADTPSVQHRKRLLDYSQKQASLATHLRLAINEVTHAHSENRKIEAVTGLTLAIRDHFPTYFKKNFGKNTNAKKILNQKVTGKIIKLKRLALASISEYL